MARTPSQRGTFGNWLKRTREERYRTQADALADMRRLAGLHIAASEFAQWESGSRVPKGDNPKVERLYEFFGSRPAEDDESGPAFGSSALVAAAIDRQTATMEAAIREQTEMLRAVLATLAGPKLTPELQAWAHEQWDAHEAATRSSAPRPLPDEIPAR